MPTVTVNGTELYHEVRGTGPPVLLIMGATGDGGHFDKLADLLADEFTVITYDRRGNGRSPVPAGWETTSPEEQADDAAALLDALGTGPAAVFSTSSGGVFAAVSDGPPSSAGARRDHARAGVVRPGGRLRGRSSPGAGADPGGDGPRGCARCSRALLVLHDRRSGLGPTRARASRSPARHRQHIVRGRARDLRAVPARR